MQRAGQIVAEAHQVARKMIRPGVSTKEIDAAVEELFARRHAVPLFKGVPGRVPFPAVTCISVNDEVVHGIPGDRVLQEGDIVSLDTGCRLGGWCGDAAWTYPVGEVDDEKQRLMASGQRVLELAIRELGRCKTWSQVAGQMVAAVAEDGFSMVEDLVGHGIGRDMHEDPQVPNYVSRGLRRFDFEIQPGLVVAIEPMVNAGGKQVRLLADHWTIAAVDGRPSVHFEHTVAVTESGPQILTEGVGAE